MNSDLFFIIFLTTILVVRIFVYLKPIPAPTIKGFRTHHYMFGIAGIIFGLAIHSAWMSTIGLGLFVDELTYILIGGKSHQDNYSKMSIAGTLFFVIIVFIFRNNLISLLN